MRQIGGFAPNPIATDGSRVWLRTLILLRWMAIFGQMAAITIADRWFHLGLPLGLCYLAVGLSIIANLVSIFVFPANRRLNDMEALASLLFDMAQLCFLLFATGGLHNPFAILILAPVTISASVLSLRSTLILGLFAIVAVTLLSSNYLPITMPDGAELVAPMLFTFGFWLAIVTSTIFLGVYAYRVTNEARALSDALLATQMALAREQKLTDLGGVIAAAAHELGTPLATIKLVSSELMGDLEQQPQLYEDAKLIREQAERCGKILRDMGRAGKDDLQLRQTPVSTLLRDAAEPHMGRGKELIFEMIPLDEGREPVVQRRPEIIHGLRNLIQNAVDFAEKRVWVDCEWDAQQITIRLIDDGEGYPPNILHRIGDPFVRARRGASEDKRRPEYEGMGLGLFIAKTLLERTGARLTFTNATDPFLAVEERGERSGALVEAVWRREDWEAAPDAVEGPNQRFEY